MVAVPGWISLILMPIIGFVAYAIKRTPRIRLSFISGLTGYFVGMAIAALIGYMSSFGAEIPAYTVEGAGIGA